MGQWDTQRQQDRKEIGMGQWDTQRQQDMKEIQQEGNWNGNWNGTMGHPASIGE
jgi:hypothetical protein